MSNFLTLVGELHREAGASGNAPTAVTNQTGEASRLVNWIRRADLQIQQKWHNWNFLWSATQYSANTVAGTQDAVKPTTQNAWIPETFRLDGGLIEVVEYQTVRGDVFSTAVADRGQPGRIIILPNQNLRFDPVPDGVYAITADYYLKPVAMTANASVSLIPEDYHDVILGQALIYYGLWENAPDALEHGKMLVDEWLPRLESAYLPNTFSSRYTSTGNALEVIAQ